MPGSQKISPNFHLKLLQNVLRVLNVSLAMSSDPQNYFVFFSWRNIRTRAYYKMAIFLHLEQFGANRIVNIQLTNSDWKPHLNLLKVFDVSLEMSGDPKNYFGSIFDVFTELDCRAFRHSEHLILLRSLEEAFSENSVKLSDCRAFSLFKTVLGCRALKFRHFRSMIPHARQVEWH